MAELGSGMGGVQTPETPECVNYLDIKLHEVLQLPPEWYESAPAANGTATVGNNNGNASVSVSGSPPAYNQHPFRYHVTMQWPAASARPLQEATSSLHQPAQVTSANVEGGGGNSISGKTGVLAASVGAPGAKKARKGTAGGAAVTPETSAMDGGDMSASLQHTTTAGAQSASTVSATALDTNPSAMQTVMLFRHGRMLTPLPSYTRYIERSVPPAGGHGDDVRPLRDVPAAVEEAIVAAKEASADTEADESGAHDTTDGTAASTTTAPVLLWVSTAETSVVKDPALGTQTADGAAGRRKAKKGAGAQGTSGNTGGASASAAAAALFDLNSPPPPLPDAQEVAPCVVRLPLTAAAEQYLQSLVRRGEPLVVTIHRTLKPNAPAEWEDLCAQYYTAEVHIPLSGFAEPGSTRATVRCPLVPHMPSDAAAEGGTLTSTVGLGSASSAPAATAAQDQKRKKAAVRKAAKSGAMPSLLCEEPDPTLPHPYTRAATSAVVSLRVGQALTRLPQDRVRPGITPAQLLPVHTAAEGATAASVDSARAMVDGGMKPFASVLEHLAKQLLLDFTRFTQEQAQLVNAQQGDAAAPSTRALFMTFVQSTGQLAAYKRQLAPLVAHMAQHARTRTGVNPQEPVDTAQLLSELYVALLDQAHHILHTMSQDTAERHHVDDKDDKDDKSNEAAPRAEAEAQGGAGKDALPVSWHRARAREAELVGDFARAEASLQAQLSLAASGHGNSVAATSHGKDETIALASLWLELADLYCRWERGHAHKAEACYREALSHAPKYVPALLHYGFFLLDRQREAEAEVYVQSAVDVEPTSPLAWACVCVLYDAKLLSSAARGGQSGAVGGALETERLYGLRKAQEALQASGVCGSAGQGGELTTSSIARIYLEAAQGALQLHHRRIASTCLTRVSTVVANAPGSASPPWGLYVARLYAHLFIQSGQFTEAQRAIHECRAALTGQPRAGAAVEVRTEPPRDDAAILTNAEAFLWDAELTVLEAWCALGSPDLPPHQRSHASVVPPPHVVASLKRVLCGHQASASGQGTEEEKEEADSQRAVMLALSCQSDETVPGSTIALPRFVSPQWWLAAYVRLSNLLVQSARYRDALGVLAVALSCWPHVSLLWIAAGTAYLRAGSYAPAEACLSEASRLDASNARVWALLALMHLYREASSSSVDGTSATETGRQRDRLPSPLVRATVKATILHGLEDAELCAELGRMLLVGGHVGLAEETLRRALGLVHDAADAQQNEAAPGRSALASTIRYHLAHALVAGTGDTELAHELLGCVEADATAAPALRAKARQDMRALVSL